MRIFKLTLIRRKNGLHKKFKVFEIVIIRNKGLKLAVVEKIGSIDLTHNKLVINIFRLIYWICFNVAVSYLCFKVLTEFYFFDLLGENIRY